MPFPTFFHSVTLSLLNQVSSRLSRVSDEDFWLVEKEIGPEVANAQHDPSELLV